MSYVAVNVNENDLLNGVFVKGGSYYRDGEFVFHLHEEDYRRGVYVKGLRANGKIVPYTWTDGDANYQASAFPNREGTGRVDLELYGGTKEQFERHREVHADFCDAHGWAQGAIVHFPS